MRKLIPAALVIALAACVPQPDALPETPTADPAPAPASAESAATKTPESIPCKDVGELFDRYVREKAGGWTEADALDDLRARGDYTLSYVVDGVFGNRFGPGGTAAARADTLAACRRIADGGTLY